MKEENLNPIWYIEYALNKSVICNGDKILLNIDIHNPDKEYWLYIDKVLLKGPKTLDYNYVISMIVPPDTKQELAFLEVPIPLQVKGEIEIKLGVNTFRVSYKENSEVDKFEELGILYRKGSIKFQVSPIPCYRAFVSRSIDPKDKPLVDPIVKMVQDWGFETITVGINSFTESHKNPADKIIEDIIRSDCLVAIATIRDQSALTGLYSTLKWLHSEISFAYMAQKPILLIVDNNIGEEGILEQKEWPIVSFRIEELKGLQYQLDEILPIFRLAVEQRKTDEFIKFIKDVQQKAAHGGYLAGIAQKQIEDSSPKINLLDTIKKIV